VTIGTISDQWAVLQDRVSRAARRAGRSLQDITIVAVTKNVPPEKIREILRCGARHMGENRVQEAERKKPLVAGAAWHLIGHLQTNKARKALEIFDSVQSLDSLRLAEALQKEAERRDRTLPCLVEVKVSEEPAKHGIDPDFLEEFLDRVAALGRLRVEGLMAVAPYFEDPERTRPYFRRVRELFERNRVRFQGERLSMGMSQDFEVAVEEGSNMIRIGTALFGARP
jgi:hypothetical protein